MVSRMGSDQFRSPKLSCMVKNGQRSNFIVFTKSSKQAFLQVATLQSLRTRNLQVLPKQFDSFVAAGTSTIRELPSELRNFQEHSVRRNFYHSRTSVGPSELRNYQELSLGPSVHRNSYNFQKFNRYIVPAPNFQSVHRNFVTTRNFRSVHRYIVTPTTSRSSIGTSYLHRTFSRTVGTS